jgi:hypothetical protein
MTNPYDSLPQRAFWRPAVGARNALEIGELWTSKFYLDKSDKVITAGSCFAQHIGKALSGNGFNWYNAEPGTGTVDIDKKYGYGIFSFVPVIYIPLRYSSSGCHGLWVALMLPRNFGRKMAEYMIHFARPSNPMVFLLGKKCKFRDRSPLMRFAEQ